MNKKLLALAGTVVLTVGGTAMADSIVVDISGAQSWEFQGNPLNDIINVGGFQVGDVINSVDWNVTISTVAPSWGDEPRIGMSDGANPAFLVLGPFGTSTTKTSANFVGSASAASYVMTGTSINLEFYESGFNDHISAPDATYLQGSSLTINFTKVPAPGVLAACGIAGLVFTRRRRSKA